jgi:dihydroorotate dehydrogenase
MAVEFCGIELEHPIINGSGTYDALAARRVFGDAFDRNFPFSAYVSKTITLATRAGNPPPRLWELDRPAEQGARSLHRRGSSAVRDVAGSADCLRDGVRRGRIDDDS